MQSMGVERERNKPTAGDPNPLESSAGGDIVQGQGGRIRINAD